MATSQLVRSEVDAGLQLIRILDAAAVGVVAALWLYSGETESWKFVLAVAGGSELASKKYLEAANAVSKWRESHPDDRPLDLGRVRFVSAADPLIRGLSPIVRMDGLGEVRFSNNLVNGVYVEDALIHRLAA